MDVNILQNIKDEFYGKQTEQQIEDPDEEVIVPNDLQDFEFESNSMTESIDLSDNHYYINSQTEQQRVKNSSKSIKTMGSSLLKIKTFKGRKKKKNRPTVDKVLDANDDDLTHMKLIEEMLGNKPQNPVVLRLPQIKSPSKNKSVSEIHSDSLLNNKTTETVDKKIIVKKKINSLIVRTISSQVTTIPKIVKPISPKVKVSKSSKPPEVRQYHNESERKRRDQMSRRFTALKNQIPKIQSEKKTPRIRILEEAISYVCRLNDGQKHLEKVLKAEAQKNDKMLKIVAELK